MYDLNWDVIVRNRDAFVDGLRLSLTLALIGLVIGSVIGLLLAFARTSRHALVRVPAAVYVEVFRNVPLLLLIYIFYFGFPIFAYQTFSRDTADLLVFEQNGSFIVALSIYAGAYLTEIFRAGILSVGRRYLDAGRSIGLTRFGLVRYVTLPIMLRTVLPSLSNTFISLFKDTALASAISVDELFYAARELGTNSFRVVEAYSTIWVLYLVTSYALAFGLRAVERRIRWSV